MGVSAVSSLALERTLIPYAEVGEFLRQVNILSAPPLRETGLYILPENDQLLAEENYRYFIYGWKIAVVPAHTNLRNRQPGRTPDRGSKEHGGNLVRDELMRLFQDIY